MERDHKQYFGEKAEAFTILGRFEMQPDRLAFTFETWPSIAAFDDGGSPSPRMARTFEPTAEEQDAKMLEAIRGKLLDILGVGGRNWTLDNFYISTIDRAAMISASSQDGERLNFSFSGDSYDKLIAENMGLVGQAMSMAWAHAKANDEYLAALTAV